MILKSYCKYFKDGDCWLNPITSEKVFCFKMLNGECYEALDSTKDFILDTIILEDDIEYELQ